MTSFKNILIAAAGADAIKPQTYRADTTTLDCRAYPAPPEEMKLRTIAHFSRRFECPAGLSDHTLDTAMPVAAGEMFTMENIRSVRPGDGLPPKYLGAILGRLAACDLQTGTPLCWEHLADEETAPCR